MDLLPYTVMIKIYMEHMKIYLEREKIKVLGLVGPMSKRGCFPAFMVHLGIMDMVVALPPCYKGQPSC